MAESSYPNAAKLLAYVKGQLSSAEAAEIEQMMTADPDFAADVEEIRIFEAAKGEKAAPQLATHQAHVKQAMDSHKKQGRPGQRFPWMSLAASLLVLMAVGTWWLNSRQMQVTPANLLSWEEVSGLRGFDDERWQQVLAPGTTGDYALAVDSLKSWLLTFPGDTEARLYLGRALALAGQQQEAQNLFFTIENDEMRLPKERLDAKWYRALVGIHGNQQNIACKILQEINTDLGKKRKAQGKYLLKKYCRE